MPNRLIFSAASTVVVLCAGCQFTGPTPLAPGAFLAPGVTAEAAPLARPAPVDRPADEMATAQGATASLPTIQPLAPLTTAPAVAASEPASQPTLAASEPVLPEAEPLKPLATGTYMTLGGVVAEVNGAPIYANRVLSLIDRVLAAKARELDSESFRAFALHQIKETRDQLIHDELEFAAAQRYLSAEDKKLVQGATMRWRQEQITKSGGSIELAKHNTANIAADNHWPEDATFDDLMHYRYRSYMQELFYERRIRPRVQVTADDIRKFYDDNRDAVFTDHEQARFRVIEIDPGASGDEAEAKGVIDALHKRIAAGADFAAVAKQTNDNAYLKANAGAALGEGVWVNRGDYRVTAVEDAAYKLKLGEVSDVIKAEGAFYLVKLEEKKTGRVRAFEDSTVQDEIRGKLSARQFAALRDKYQADLAADALIRGVSNETGGEDDSMLQPALEMALQKYTPRTAAAQ